MHTDIRVRRVYDEPSTADGMRVLVDRIWPRGLAKAAARVDEWAKDVAPSTELRKWYGHEPGRFGEFRRRYAAELDRPASRAALQRLRSRMANGPLTLLTATKDVGHSQAVVLADLLRGTPPGEPDAGAEGGEAACWAHLLCPECGAVQGEDHHSSCSLADSGR